METNIQNRSIKKRGKGSRQSQKIIHARNRNEDGRESREVSGVRYTGSGVNRLGFKYV